MQEIHTMKVLLPGGDKVSAFVKATSACPFSIHLSSGRYRINAKSIIGIFSLDLSKPLTVEAKCSDEEAETLFSALQPFAAGGKGKKEERRFSLFGNK